jgi:hypothetical protein
VVSSIVGILHVQDASISTAAPTVAITSLIR